MPKALLRVGKNVVKVRFTSLYVTDGEGVHYFKDPADEKEYIYSQFECYNTHKCFPCFNQPNLKAPLDLLVFAQDQ